MRIIFAVSHLTVFVGGGKFLTDYANTFAQRGHEITIITQKINRSLYRCSDAIHVIEVGGPLPSSFLYWCTFKSSIKRYLNAFKANPSDLIVSIGFPASYFCSAASRIKNVPHIFFCLEPFRYFFDKKFCARAPLRHKIGYWLVGSFFKKLDIQAALSADAIFTISSFTKERIFQLYKKTSLVHLIGIKKENQSTTLSKQEFRKIIGVSDMNCSIVFALGLTHQLKGENELIEIFYRIHQQDPQAILLIGGWQVKRNETVMRSCASRLGIPQEKIIFYGFVEHDLLNEFYRNSDLTLYTAIDESYGYIPIESMSNATAVIAFEGGPSDTIVNGKTGFVIQNQDIDEFASKALLLLGDKKTRTQFSHAAQQHVNSNFDLAHQAQLLEEELRKIIF